MRRILFRGKEKSKGEWIEGDLHSSSERTYILTGMTGNFRELGEVKYREFICLEVEPGTVGQYTGLNDLKNNKIFEKNIVKAIGHTPENYEVKFIEGGFCMCNPDIVFPIDINHFYPSNGCMVEIVGDSINAQKP